LALGPAAAEPEALPPVPEDEPEELAPVPDDEPEEPEKVELPGRDAEDAETAVDGDDAVAPVTVDVVLVTEGTLTVAVGVVAVGTLTVAVGLVTVGTLTVGTGTGSEGTLTVGTGTRERLRAPDRKQRRHSKDTKSSLYHVVVPPQDGSGFPSSTPLSPGRGR